jgi:hypothetical protein
VLKLYRILGLAGGAAIWLFSPKITGRAEPWDGEGLYYWAALFACGWIVGLVDPKGAKDGPLWIVAGQSAFVIASVLFKGKELGLFFPMGLLALLLFSLVSYAGAFLGAKITR